MPFDHRALHEKIEEIHLILKRMPAAINIDVYKRK